MTCPSPFPFGLLAGPSQVVCFPSLQPAFRERLSRAAEREALAALHSLD